MNKSILLAILIIIGIIITTPNPLRLLSSGISNVDLVNNITYKCKALPKKEDWRVKAILRIDDVQGYGWSDISKRMMSDAFSYNAPVTIAAIPNKLVEDKSLTSFLNKNHCNIDIALHGWDHSENPPEFAQIDAQSASERIKNGLAVLKKITPKPISVFIPPQNLYSEAAKSELLAKGFKAISSEGETEYDYNAATFDFTTSRLKSTEEVFDECKKAFVEYGRCIIMLHPQDYANGTKMDREKYKSYLELLKTLDQSQVLFTTIADEVIINSNTHSPSSSRLEN